LLSRSPPRRRGQPCAVFSLSHDLVRARRVKAKPLRGRFASLDTSVALKGRQLRGDGEGPGSRSKVQQRPLTVANQHDRQHAELAGMTAKCPAAPLVRDEEAPWRSSNAIARHRISAHRPGGQAAWPGQRAGRTRTGSSMADPVSKLIRGFHLSVTTSTRAPRCRPRCTTAGDVPIVCPIARSMPGTRGHSRTLQLARWPALGQVCAWPPTSF
jgi:hypothetical protein